MDFLPEHKPWYRTRWKVVILVIAVIALVVAPYFHITQQEPQRVQPGALPLEGVNGQITYGNVRAPQNPQADRAYQTGGDVTFGNAAAPLKIVEFADFECEYSRAESFVIRELQIEFPDKISFTYRDFPLTDVHPMAFRAAEAGKCANEQGKFWVMHDKMFQNQDNLTDDDLKRYALEGGLDATKFNNCLDTQKYKLAVEKDMADGVAAGVVGTPTFFINGRRVPGAILKDAWLKVLAVVK